MSDVKHIISTEDFVNHVPTVELASSSSEGKKLVAVTGVRYEVRSDEWGVIFYYNFQQAVAAYNLIGQCGDGSSRPNFPDDIVADMAISQNAFLAGCRVLIDNGIEISEAQTVMQALCCVMLDTETEPLMQDDMPCCQNCTHLDVLCDAGSYENSACTIHNLSGWTKNDLRT